MTGPARLAASLLLALTAFGVGRLTSPAPEPPVVLTPEAVPDGSRSAAFRDALAAARQTADAGSLRAQAHEILNTAEGELSLADGIELLGWTGTDADAPWLDSLARSDDPALQGPAILALGRLGTPAAVTTLLDLESRPDLRGWVLDALGHTRDPRAAALLTERLSDEAWAAPAALALARFGDPEGARAVTASLERATARNAAGLALALARFPGEAPRQALYDTLRTGQRIHCDAALGALAQVRDPIVLDLLLADLATGTADQKTQAANHLGVLGDPRAIHALHNAALDGNRTLQSTAVSALSRIDTRTSRRVLLDLIDTGPSPVAMQAIWSMKDPTDPDAVAVLTGSWRRRPWDVRGAIGNRLFHARWTLGQVPPSVLELARNELADPPPGGASDAPAFLLDHGTDEDVLAVEALLEEGSTMTRTRIVQTLATWPGASATGLLMARVEDPEPNVRDAAVRALLQRGIDASRLEEPLLAALTDSANAHGRVEQLLVELGTERAIAAVQARLTEGTLREQQSAVQALAWAGDARTNRELLTIAADADNPSQRRQIYQSLMWSASGPDVDLAHTLLEDEDPGLRSIAIQILGQAGPEGRDTLVALASGDDDDLRRQALGSLGHVGGPDAEALLIASLDEPDGMGASALSALTQLGTRSSREVLVETARSHTDPSVRTQALNQLGWTTTEGGPAAIREALDDEDPAVRQTALSALEGTGSTAAAQDLVGLLDDEDPDFARQAAHALERLGGPLAERHKDDIEALTQVDPLGEDLGGDYVDAEFGFHGGW